MSKEKHTPGPWEVQTERNHYGTYRVKQAAKRHRAWLIPKESDRDVDRSYGEMERGEEAANAALIAAAPDLLEAAAGMLDRLETNNGGHPLDPVQQRGWAARLRAAIAKARGESS